MFSKFFKKLTCFSIIFFSCVVLSVSTSLAAERKISYISVDGKTGSILLQKSSIELRHPASLTKIMTLYLLFDAINKGRVRLDTPFQVSVNAASKPASKLYVSPKSPILVNTAIDALIIKSANDVATVVAENLAGSEEEFAKQMSSAARQLDMKSTVFKNASGLHHDGQVTTAFDMALLVIAIQDRFPHLYKRFSKSSFKYGKKTYHEYNPMLGAVVGVDGVKTGFTKKSGFNLATNRKYDNQHIVAIVLGAQSSKERTKVMSKVLSDSKKVASKGQKTMPKHNKKIYTDPFFVDWKNGKPQVAFGTKTKTKRVKYRGKKVSPSFKPGILLELPDNFFARDEKTLKIMLRDIARLGDNF